MFVVFRTDASPEWGMGHLVRCTTLGRALVDRGARVAVVTAAMPEEQEARVRSMGMHVERIEATPDQNADSARTIEALQRFVGPGTSDWVVSDHYGLDAGWERALRPFTHRLMAIDDLADRRHDCDLLLDQNLGSEDESRYRGLVPDGCRLMLGPRYALLRGEFVEARSRAVVRTGPLRRVLVSFGATDPTGEAVRAITALRSLSLADLDLDVVAPDPAGHAALRAAAAGLPAVRIHTWTDSMAGLMTAADLALGAGGSTSWERCYLGLPSVTVIVAENQRATTVALARAGATVAVDGRDSFHEAALAAAVRRFADDDDFLRLTSVNAFAVMGDPLPSGTDLVVSTIMEGV